MFRTCLCAVAVILFSAVSSPAHGQSAGSRKPPRLLVFRAKVKVDIISETVRGESTSYVTRSLRSLPDVELVPLDAEYEFGLVICNVAVGGRITGYAIAWNFSKIPNLKNLYDAKLIDKGVYNLFTKHQILVEPSGNGLIICPVDGLEKACSDLTAKFDGKVLEFDRQFISYTSNMLRKSQNMR